MSNQYKQLNGTSFDVRTNDSVMRVLEDARTSRKRIRIFYGDTNTGKAWNEENNVLGTVGRSTGTIQIPLLLANARSIGGGGILDYCIVKIMDAESKRVLYKHPYFQTANFILAAPPTKIGNVNMKGAGYVAGVYADGENIANFKTVKAAQNYIAFMRGERMSK